MFEVGRHYRITTSDHNGPGSSSAIVLEVEMPLIKVSKVGSYEIINTSAPSFIGAEPDDAEAKADRAAEMERINKALGLD